MATLVFIDDPSVHAAIEDSFLDRPDFSTERLDSAARILDRAQSGGVDLIVAATTLPDMSGVALLDRLRRDPRTSAIPVILVGPASQRPPDGTEAADCFEPLPLGISRLLARIRRTFPLKARAARRARTVLKVLCGDGPAAHLAFTRDLSSAGAFVRDSVEVRNGQQVRLRIDIPSSGGPQHLDIMGEVVRRAYEEPVPSKPTGYGVRFVDLPLDKRLPIARFVRARARRSWA